MAKISFDGFDEIARMLANESDRFEKHAADALNAGAAVAKAAMQEKVNVSENEGRGHSGHLRDHITVSELKHSQMDGYSVDVYPDGIRDDGQRYATVGFVLEYGRSNMRARPWMKPAVKAKEKDIAAAIREELMK